MMHLPSMMKTGCKGQWIILKAAAPVNIIYLSKAGKRGGNMFNLLIERVEIRMRPKIENGFCVITISIRLLPQFVITL